jgi:WXG100 family type VII secretion target
MGDVSVTYQDISDAAARLRTGRHEITEKLHTLARFVQDLVNSGYVTDRSSRRFDDAYREFTSGATTTVEGLDGMAAFLDGAAEAFREADERLARGLGG